MPPRLRIAARVVLGLAGLAGIAMGISALSKLRESNLDSPRWQFALGGCVAIAAGGVLLWWALVRLRSSGPRSKPPTTEPPERRGDAMRKG